MSALDLNLFQGCVSGPTGPFNAPFCLLFLLKWLKNVPQERGQFYNLGQEFQLLGDPWPTFIHKHRFGGGANCKAMFLMKCLKGWLVGL